MTERPAKDSAEIDATAPAETRTDENDSGRSEADDLHNADIIKRMYLLYGVAVTAISIVLTDTLYRFGLPLWAAVPLGLTFWTANETLVYRGYKRLRDGNTDSF